MSKRRKTGIIVLCLLPAALLVWLDRSPIRDKWQSQPISGEQAKAADIEKYHERTFTVVTVVDGDTLDINVADSRYPHTEGPLHQGYTRIRLLGVDAPEAQSGEYGSVYFGPQAARFATDLALGKHVTTYLDKSNDTRGKYGRLLAYVKLPDGRFLNEVLLTEGFTYADLRFRHSLYNRYKQLEASARSLKKGLWEKAIREQLPQWLQRMQPNLLKK